MGLSYSCCNGYLDYYVKHRCYVTSNKHLKICKKETLCCSCKKTIKPRELILDFKTWSIDEAGNKLYGDVIVFCSRCSDYYLFLEYAGFCVNLEGNMPELALKCREEYLKNSLNKK
jgi:hypothetical protein